MSLPKSLWVNEHGVSLGWLWLGECGRTCFRWDQLDRPWISNSRIGWGSGPIDSFVFRPRTVDWPDVADCWTAKISDVEVWRPPNRSQAEWPRAFLPHGVDELIEPLGQKHVSIRLIKLLHQFSLSLPALASLGLLAGFGFLFWVARGIPRSAGTALGVTWFMFVLSVMSLGEVVVELVLRHVTLACAVVTRPFPVTLLINSIIALIFTAGTTIACLWLLATLSAVNAP